MYCQSVEGSQGEAFHNHNELQPNHYSLSLYTLFHTLANSLAAELSFLSPAFTSVSAEIENVGNSLKSLDTKLAMLRAKAICDARAASSFRPRRLTLSNLARRWAGEWRRRWTQSTLDLALRRYHLQIFSAGKCTANIRWLAKRINTAGIVDTFAISGFVAYMRRAAVWRDLYRETCDCKNCLARETSGKSFSLKSRTRTLRARSFIAHRILAMKVKDNFNGITFNANVFSRFYDHLYTCYTWTN